MRSRSDRAAVLRILHLSHGYPPAVGGSETVMRELSERLARDHGHDVTVVTTTAYNTAAFRIPGERTMLPGEEWRGPVRVRRHAADPRLAPRLRRVQELAFRFRLPANGVLRTLYDGPLAPGMLMDASRLPANLIAATAFPLLHMQFAVGAGRLRRVPVVLLGALHPADRWGYDRRPIDVAARMADAYVAYTEHEAEYVERRGVRRERIHVIPPGVEPPGTRTSGGASVRARLGIPRSAPVVGFVGQIGGHKGVDDLVAALPLVWAMRPDVHLLIAGARTDFLPVVEEAIEHLPAALRGRVHLLLDFAPAEKWDVLAAMNVFASPSGFESFGLTFVEAWLAGLAVVGCRAGAVPSVVTHGEDGLLVGYKSVPELAGALVELLDDETLRARLAEAGHAKARERYTWARCAAQVASLYERLVALRHGV